MTKHDFDFDDSMTVAEFFKKNKVAKSNRKYLVKQCTSEKGNVFPAVGFATGNTLDDGRPEYAWFVLSRRLEEQGETLNKAFLKEHKEDLMLLEPPLDEDGNPELAFGICYLAGGAEDWDDL